MQIELADSNGNQTKIPQKHFSLKTARKYIYENTFIGGKMHLKNVSTIAEASCCVPANLLP